jgi:hypothetical protein
MMTIKQQLWDLRKKAVRQAKILRGVPRPAGYVGLSEEGAQAAYGSRGDIAIHTFNRAGAAVPVAPKHLPGDEAFDFLLSRFPEKFPDYEAVLLDIRNPDFTFQHHHLLDDQHRVIYEPQMNLGQLPIKDAFLTDGKKLNGTVAYLANTLFCQYGHWLQRQLPMLLPYWELFGKENIDYYYIGDGTTPAYAKESLRRLGIRDEQIVDFPCRGDRALMCCKFMRRDPRPAPRTGFRLDEASHRFLQSGLFQPGAPVGGRRLFIQRGQVSGRKELNLPQIKEALEPLGFEFTTTQGMTMQHEADLFGNADVMVAVHGAALHNLLFARPGTRVIEMFPFDYFEESNYVIAALGGCDYSYLIGEPVGNSFDGAELPKRNRADIRVDPAKLLRLLEQAGIS